ncbi:MAG TPA: hypothetical protein VI504_11975 [Candidatus Eisenbacteria bacterium]
MPVPAGSDPHTSEAVCIDLLHGLLPDSERDAILEHMKACSVCEETLRRLAGERERLMASERSRQFLGMEAPAAQQAGSLAGQPATANGVRSRPSGVRGRERLWTPRRLGLWIPAIAAAAAAILFWLPRGGDRALPKPRWLPRATDAIESRATPGVADSLMLGLSSYARHDVRQAIARLETTPEADRSNESLRRIYLGSALAWSGDYRKAVDILYSVEMSAVPEPWNSETRWTLYTALRGARMDAPADSLRRVLAREPGELGQRARAER